MQRAKRQRLSNIRSCRVIGGDPKLNPTYAVLRNLDLGAFDPTYASTAMATQPFAVTRRERIAVPLKIPVEVAPAVPGLSSITVCRAEEKEKVPLYERLKSYNPIITYANSKRGGKGPMPDGGRAWPVLSSAERAFTPETTFQYHGIVHTSQARLIPHAFGQNVDTLMFKFAGSIPTHYRHTEPTKNEFWKEHQVNHDLIESKESEKVIGTRAIKMKIGIYQGHHRYWMLGPGTISQEHDVEFKMGLYDDAPETPPVLYKALNDSLCVRFEEEVYTYSAKERVDVAQRMLVINRRSYLSGTLTVGFNAGQTYPLMYTSPPRQPQKVGTCKVLDTDAIDRIDSYELSPLYLSDLTETFKYKDSEVTLRIFDQENNITQTVECFVAVQVRFLNDEGDRNYLAHS